MISWPCCCGPLVRQNVKEGACATDISLSHLTTRKWKGEKGRSQGLNIPLWDMLPNDLTSCSCIPNFKGSTTSQKVECCWPNLKPTGISWTPKVLIITRYYWEIKNIYIQCMVWWVGYICMCVYWKTVTKIKLKLINIPINSQLFLCFRNDNTSCVCSE